MEVILLARGVEGEAVEHLVRVRVRARVRGTVRVRDRVRVRVRGRVRVGVRVGVRAVEHQVAVEAAAERRARPARALQCVQRLADARLGQQRVLALVHAQQQAWARG